MAHSVVRNPIGERFSCTLSALYGGGIVPRVQHGKEIEMETEVSEWITLREAADYWSVTDRTIRNWIHAGRVRAVRVGPKLIRVDKKSIATLAPEVTGSGEGV